MHIEELIAQLADLQADHSGTPRRLNWEVFL
jgi:hypothetical protein